MKTTTVRRGYLVTVAAAIMLAAVCLVLLPSTQTRLLTGGITADSAESVRAEAQMTKYFPTARPDIVLVLTPGSTPTATLDDVLGEVRSLTGVTGVHSVPTAGGGDSSLAFVTVAPEQPAHVITDIAEAADDIGDRSGVQVTATGDKVIDGSIDVLAEESLVRAELFAAPVVALILLVVFGSVWAAMIPLLAGAVAVAIAMLGLNLLTRVTDVSAFALNLATAIGFGLAIDYSLFLVARWREGRQRGLSPEDARELAVRTSGRTIIFSGMTVVIAMAALLVFPGYFLKSLAYSGILTVTAVMAVTIGIVPRLLVLLGDRATRRYAWSRWASIEREPASGSSSSVRPQSRVRSWATVIVVTAVLLVVAAPFLGAHFILRDYRELPVGDPARVAAEQVVADFPEVGQGSVDVVFEKAPDDASLAGAAERIASLDHVAGVAWSGGTARRSGTGQVLTEPAGAPGRATFVAADGATWMRVDLAVDPGSPEAATVLRQVRTAVAGLGALVGGQTALVVDTTDGLGAALPYAITAIVVVTAVLLFLLTGSVVLPLIGVALSVLSLGATFGLLVHIFQDGNFAGVLGGFTAFGAINVSAPILLFCIAYGLSMDYQMFILARIAEEHAAGRSGDEAVRIGIATTRRVIGAAAILISVVLAAMATSGLTYLKILGLGLTVAVLVDAFVVRLFLLPAVMRICGDAVWYRPRLLDGVYRRMRLSHES
ncbi:MMPL family transporter [Gordonia amarae]|nr:MMPL family transporter [Gordonia amarae]MCS3879654.1 RND superfamily putative drug exporter [Gordonia amarae]QHN18098.1 MMPL family transporter [Gordonia amarae]QHN22619.1 MMPL family transporter [Gordonia amarae]QHN31485.1 MMPL family transporter [Gordonia amarae]QHN40229.1 MMPL family transporter [Gordonia amarae]